MKQILSILLLTQVTFLTAQIEEQMTGQELLTRCIKYHDPLGNWSKFRQRIIVSSETKDKTTATIFEIDMVKGDFKMIKSTEGARLESGILQGKTFFSSINGNPQINESDRKKYRLSDAQIKNARHYYTYLYGLPMKLRDNGTKVANEVQKDTFNGKTYFILKVDYEVAVGTDTWYFYINPNNYALEGYRFFHNKQPNDGEFIILKNTIEMQNIKIPSTRIWYLNKDSKYLGTDRIEGSEILK